MRLNICKKYKIPEQKKILKTATDYLREMKVNKSSVLVTPKQAVNFYVMAKYHGMKIVSLKQKSGKVRVWRVK